MTIYLKSEWIIRDIMLDESMALELLAEMDKILRGNCLLVTLKSSGGALKGSEMF